MPRERKHIQISKEAFDELAKLKRRTGLSVFKLVDILTGLTELDDAFKTYEDKPLFEGTTLKKYNPVNKPDPSIIDCAILSVWTDSNDTSEKSRNRFLAAVETRVRQGWTDLYPKWFKGYDKRQSKFELSVDSRLRALSYGKLRGKTGLINRTDAAGNRGKYKLVPQGLTTYDWQVIRGINAIKANSGFRSKSGILSLLFQ